MTKTSISFNFQSSTNFIIKRALYYALFKTIKSEYPQFFNNNDPKLSQSVNPSEIKEKNRKNHDRPSLVLTENYRCSKVPTLIHNQISLQRSTMATSRWNQREKYLYYYFLNMALDDFSSRSQRKTFKVFSYAAAIVGTKTSTQTKSYHQKLIHNHQTIERYLDHYFQQNSQNLQKFETQYLTPKIKEITKLHDRRAELQKKEKNRENQQQSNVRTESEKNDYQSTNNNKAVQTETIDPTEHFQKVREDSQSLLGNYSLQSFSIPQL